MTQSPFDPMASYVMMPVAMPRIIPPRDGRPARLWYVPDGQEVVIDLSPRDLAQLALGIAEAWKVLGELSQSQQA
jgi:hypothetical protein